MADKKIKNSRNDKKYFEIDITYEVCLETLIAVVLLSLEEEHASAVREGEPFDPKLERFNREVILEVTALHLRVHGNLGAIKEIDPAIQALYSGIVRQIVEKSFPGLS